MSHQLHNSPALAVAALLGLRSEDLFLADKNYGSVSISSLPWVTGRASIPHACICMTPHASGRAHGIAVLLEANSSGTAISARRPCGERPWISGSGCRLMVDTLFDSVHCFPPLTKLGLRTRTIYLLKIITTGGLNAPALPPARPRARVC